MNKASILIGLAVGVATLVSNYQRKTTENSSGNESSLKKRLKECGFWVSANNLGPSEIVRFRGGYEELMNLAYPERANEKPPLPENLDIESLPKYSCGCPHCGKMSMCGENQWRYQELHRTRERWNNTTTYLVKCQNCQGFMKSTVDHND